MQDEKCPPTVVFDTDCVLCSGMTAFVLRHERDDELHFVGAWSEEGLRLAAEHGMAREDLQRTFLVVVDGKAFTRSDAAFEIARHLRAPWNAAPLAVAVPRCIRDGAYDAMARHRYRIFGRKEDCTVVPPSQAHRFHGVKGAPNRH